MLGPQLIDAGLLEHLCSLLKSELDSKLREVTLFFYVL